MHRLTDEELMKVIVLSFIMGRGDLGATREDIFDALVEVKRVMREDWMVEDTRLEYEI
jgi:hypothetical protein